MSITYTPATNFTAKDSMATSNPDKVLSGVPFDFEFNAIKSAFEQAAPSVSPTFTGTLTADAIVATTVNGSTTSNWDTAFGWGNHATAGYLTAETDPIFSASAASGIVAGDITNWDAAFAWGNHAGQGYITTETDPVFSASASAGIVAGDITNWNSAYNDSIGNLSFNDATGVLTLTQRDTQTLTVDLDGRYAVVAELDQYTAGAGLTLTGNSFAHTDTSTQASVTNTGQTFIQSLSFDTFGHVTGATSGVATDTNTDTTYSAGAGISLAGTVFSHADTSSVSSANNAGNTFVQDLTFDTYGHVTAIVSATASDTNTTYTAGAGLSLSGTSFSHADTSSQASVTNTGQNFIRSIGLDTYGHITSIATGTATDTNTTYSAGSNLSLSGTTFNLATTLSGLTDVSTAEVSQGNFALNTASSTQWQLTYGGSQVLGVSSTGALTGPGLANIYSAGSGISKSGTTFSHADTSSVTTTSNTGQTFIQNLTFDTYGHVTAATSGTAVDTNTDTTYTAGSGLSLSGTTFSHSDTSSVANTANSGTTFIQNLNFDTYGHVTSATSAAVASGGSFGDFTISASGTDLFIDYQGTNIFKITSVGDVLVKNNLTAFQGTIS